VSSFFSSFTVLNRNCYLVEKSSLPTLSSPLFIHILSNGNRKRTSGLGGVDSFFWILRSFFSSLEGENCHRSLTTGFAGFFRRLDFASMIRTRRSCRPIRKTVAPRIPSPSTGAVNSIHPSLCNRVSNVPTHCRDNPNFRARVV